MTNIKSFKSFITESVDPIKSSSSSKKTEKDVTGNLDFKGKILIIGFGAVGSDLLPIVLKHVTKNPSNVTVIEKDDHGKIFRERYGKTGVKYIKKEIVKSNLTSTLAKYVSSGGFVMDVSLDIGCEDILKWCFENDVHYLNTSIERWKTLPDEEIPNLSERTLYHAHKKMHEFAKQYKGAKTAGIGVGANPGNISLLTKECLLIIADKTGIKYKKPEEKEDWAQLAKKLGVEVLQVAERDSQIIDVPKQVNTFVSSWSPEGFCAEGRCCAEMGWGTHEPDGQEDVIKQGSHAAYLPKPGVSVVVKSWAPLYGPFNANCIQHSESITLSKYLQTADKSYSPTIYYSYQPTDAALASVHEFKGRELDMDIPKRVIKDEIIDGTDEMGILAITNKGKSYWYGSSLNIHTARKLLKGCNATSLQVVANILGTIVWMLENPNCSYTEPEYMDHELILKHAKPYLGDMVFAETDWHPTSDKNDLFYREIDEKHPNCFSNFRVWN